MSKIGRKPIDISKTQVNVAGQKVTIKGANGSVVVDVPDTLNIILEGKSMYVEPAVDLDTVDHTLRKSIKMNWGLYRAFLNNHVLGMVKPFESELHIIGLGYKAVASGKSITFSLGYSHKIDFTLPDDVSVEIDKTGQRIMVRSTNKESVGKVCSDIKSLRPTEPYKGTGIKLADEVILRKAGKTKSA
jgi:large subunit ribosomal protein L6